MDEIQQLINIVQVAILVGAVGRIVYCLIMTAMDNDEEQSYRVRARNVVIFLVVAETITHLLRVIPRYF